MLLFFWIKFAQIGDLRMKTEKVNITIEFCILELVYVPNFTLNKVLNFEAKASQKGYFPSRKWKKWTSSFNSAYSN